MSRSRGAGCSISQSSASMMTEAVQGKTLDHAKTLAAQFRSMMAGDAEPDEAVFGDLVSLKGVVKYPIRIKCAVLGWDVLQDALDGDGVATDSRRTPSARISSRPPAGAGEQPRSIGAS